MYNEDLENLIEFAIMDGKLTEKERDILLQKAKSLDINVDEFNLVLDAKLKYLKSKLNANLKIEKCPNCGDVINGLSLICPSCDFVNSTYNTSDLDEKIEDLHKDIVQLNTYPPSSYIKALKSISFIILTYGIYMIYKLHKKEPLFFGNVKTTQYKLLQSSIESKIKILLLKYGKNACVEKTLAEFQLECQECNYGKKRFEKQQIILSILFSILLSCIIVPFWFSFSYVILVFLTI